MLRVAMTMCCLGAVPFLGGCDQLKQQIAADMAGEVERRVTASQEEARRHLLSEIEALKGQNEDLSDRLSTIEIERLIKNRSEGYFDPAGESGYARIDHNNGFFLVSLADAKPFADGYEVTFSIGNPLDARFNGLELSVKWGPRLPEIGQATKEEWEKYKNAPKREKKFSLPNTIEPGTWNRVKVRIAPARPEDIGRIGLAVATNNVGLKGR